jgi:uncharacterized membrane protein
MDFWTFIFGIAVGLVSIMIFNRFFKNDSIAEDLKEQFKNLSNEILVQQADAIVEKATNTVKTTNEMIINPLEVQLEKMKVSLEDI